MSIGIRFSVLKASFDHLDLEFDVKWNLSTIHIAHQWSGRTGSYLQMNRLSLKNNRLKFKTAEKITDYFRGIYRIYLNLLKRNRRMSTGNQLDLQTLLH